MGVSCWQVRVHPKVCLEEAPVPVYDLIPILAVVRWVQEESSAGQKLFPLDTKAMASLPVACLACACNSFLGLDGFLTEVYW